MKIAIIGSGVAGLTSAFFLAPEHEVVVYEKDTRIGGHAHTLQIEHKGKKIQVDNGFMVFNPERYPNFIKLLEKLQVESTPTTMTLSVNIPGEVSYKGELPHALLAKKTNLLSIRFIKFLFGVVAFKKQAKRSLRIKEDASLSLRDFFNKYPFNPDVASWFLYPVLSAVWSIEHKEKIDEFPAISTFQFLDNHKLLNFFQPTWRTIVGGSVQYTSRIKEYIENYNARILLNQKITSITRKNKHIYVESNNKKERFDYIILATHANTAKRLLTDISVDEINALSKFTYSKNLTVLHRDTRFTPTNKKLLASWNYMENNGKSSFTYCMNILQHIAFETPVLVTLNPQQKIDPAKTYAIDHYEHPRYTLDVIEGQRLISKLQGKNRTYFAGAHLGYGFHEDGVVSAIRVAKLLGIKKLWR